MKIFSLPLYAEQTARWSSRFDLDNRRFLFYFSWNTRCNYWELSIYDENDVLLAAGIRLVTLIDLLDLHRRRVKQLPKGELLLVQNSDKVSELSRDNLGIDYSILYVER